MTARHWGGRLALALLLSHAMPASEVHLEAGLNRFAAATYSEVARGGGNLIFSPLCLSTGLSMALAGARGQTAAEMAALLGRPHPDPGYQAALAALVTELTKAATGGGNELRTANNLWVQKGFRLLPDFLQSMRTFYHSPLTRLDFAAPEQSRMEINAWTARETNGKIRELFPAGSLEPDMRLILTSAVYFYGHWASAFAPSQTYLEPFRLEGGGTAKASFMHQTARFGYLENGSLQILEMRYAGTPLAFDVLLPKAAGGLPDVEKSMREGALAGWLGGLEPRTVEVAMPKFRAESEFSLRDALARLGMASAFSGSADFSGIDDRRDLMLADVRHKAFVDVSEKGTEAAAATGTAVRLIAMQAPPHAVFRADHPFSFLIRDTRSGVVLFSGRLVKP